jgi:hypothetical protein
MQSGQREVVMRDAACAMSAFRAMRNSASISSSDSTTVSPRSFAQADAMRPTRSRRRIRMEAGQRTLRRCALQLDARRRAAYQRMTQRDALMPKPRTHIRHLCRTFYLSEWWDE